MVTPLKIQTLIPSKAPNLPIAPVEYNQAYQDQLLNALRLYFNQIDNFSYGLSNTSTGGGGTLLTFPYGAFHQDGTTTLTSGITNNSTTPIPVVSTSSFPSAGYILIGTEIIQYTGTTFTTFTGITRGVLGTSGNKAAYSTGAQVSETQGTGSGTTIGTVRFNNTDYSNQVSASLTDNTKIIFGAPGLYNIQISLQLANFTNSVDNVTTWFIINGNNVPNTASIQAVPANHGTVGGSTILAYNVFQRFNLKDALQIGWTTDSGNSVIVTYPAGITPVHPVSPAVILTAQFVSA